MPNLDDLLSTLAEKNYTRRRGRGMVHLSQFEIRVWTSSLKPRLS